MDETLAVVNHGALWSGPVFVFVCSDSGLCLIFLQLLIFTPVVFTETFHSFVFPAAVGLKRRQIPKQNP